MTELPSEITAGNVVTSLALAMQKCPCCRRPVISSQIMGSCERCEVEQAAAEEILRLRDIIGRQSNRPRLIHTEDSHIPAAGFGMDEW